MRGGYGEWWLWVGMVVAWLSLQVAAGSTGPAG